jgi:ATP-dependent DNA helicase RecQ
VPPTDVLTVARDLLDDVTRLRPGQHEAMEAVLERDTLAVLATGTGKSLIYQVAATVIDGPTVVVSPTISLQADQLAALHESGARAEAINSTRRVSSHGAILEDFAAGRLEYLLLAPEQLAKPEVVAPLTRAGVSLFVVDEAHCVSMWGEDFRPDYLALAAVIGTLGHPRVLALTATASAATRERIVAALAMTDPAVVVGDVDRPEIWLGRREVVDDEDVARELVALVRPAAEAGETVIVYAATRRRVEELTTMLHDHGLSPVAYHGGLAAKERTRIHDGFRHGDMSLVVATSAFGLGVDRPDVRLVVHADPPQRLDDYWQEAGRAGRDGRPARAVLMTYPSGYGVRRYFAAGTGARPSDIADVVEALRAADGPLRPSATAAAAGLSAARSRRAANVLIRTGAIREAKDGLTMLSDEPLDDVVREATELLEGLRIQQETGVDLVRRYAETNDCRRRLVLELLGEEHPQPCGHCDSCDAGTSTSATDRPFALGSAVEHPEWGVGTVSQYEDDRVVVLFDDAGYRTLSLQAVHDRRLLVEAVAS